MHANVKWLRILCIMTARKKANARNWLNDCFI